MTTTEPRSRPAPRLERIVLDIARGQSIPQHRQTLIRAGQRAVPALLVLLDHLPRKTLPALLDCLDVCWSELALEPVMALLTDRSAAIRNAAARVLDRNIGRTELAELCAKLIDHPNPRVAAFAAWRTEAAFPDRARMGEFIHRQWPPELLCRFMARYYDPALRPATRALLEISDAKLRRAAIIALLHQNDDSKGARQRIVDFLNTNDPGLREAAAEYLSRHGTRAELSAIEAAAKSESDPHALAALRGAHYTLTRRLEHQPAKTAIAPPAERSDVDGATAYQQVLNTLASQETPGVYQSALTHFAAAENFEPLWMVDNQQAPSDAFRTSRALRYRAQCALFTPWLASGEAHAISATSPATHLIAAIGDFPRRPTKSYGLYQGARARLFDSLVHIGEDVGWYQDHATIVSIAPGVVRECSHEESWGHLVIIEHRADAVLTRRLLPRFRAAIEGFSKIIREPVIDAEGCLSFCALYAHLGADRAIAIGDTVEGGQRIGVIGRSYTWENGGYAAHLHFSIHLGPYRQIPRNGAIVDCNYQGRSYRARVTGADAEDTIVTIVKNGQRLRRRLATNWVRGYISLWAWRSNQHGWLHPAPFIRSGAPRSSPAST